jgi:dienelactone hydrolase
MACALAQREFPPPQGQGRVVVVLSGHDGATPYVAISTRISQLGYDVVLFDATAMVGSNGAAVVSAIDRAMKMPHALPGKIAVVGFSLGGGMALAYTTQLTDLVAGVVAWYPATNRIDVASLAVQLKVPVLMFAGEKDVYMGCCLIATARSLADGAKMAGKPFELISYPDTGHDFIDGTAHYNARSYVDAMQRMAARLKDYLS